MEGKMQKNAKLKTELFEKSLSQEELSRQTGIPRAYISLAINGKFNLTEDQRQKIAKTLRCDESKIFEQVISKTGEKT